MPRKRLFAKAAKREGRKALRDHVKQWDKQFGSPTTDEPVRTCNFVVTAKIHPTSLFLHQVLAAGSAKHGRVKYDVEVAVAMGEGGVMITVKDPAFPNQWTTYAISPETLIEAAMTQYLKDQPRTLTELK